MLLDIEINNHDNISPIQNQTNEYQNINIEEIISKTEEKIKKQMKIDIFKCICKQIIRLFFFTIIMTLTYFGLNLSKNINDEKYMYIYVKTFQTCYVITILLISIILIRMVP